jgi:hypothetical protein
MAPTTQPAPRKKSVTLGGPISYSILLLVSATLFQSFSLLMLGVFAWLVYGGILLIRKLGKFGIGLVVVSLAALSTWIYLQYREGLPNRTLTSQLTSLGASSLRTTGRPWVPVVHSITFGEGTGDEELRQVLALSGLEEVEEISFHESTITDEPIAGLARFVTLKSIYFEDTKVTPEAVERLQQELPNCEIRAKRWRKFTRKPEDLTTVTAP